MQVDRLYHAGALLLPDGRVMAAGSNPERRMNELRIEIFRPPYLFRGSRPVISKYPPNVSYGKEFEVETDDASHINAVALMHPSVTTHCVNTEQRYIGLEYKQKNSNTLLVNVPSNRNVIPPGYYMLFAISGDGCTFYCTICSSSLNDTCKQLNLVHNMCMTIIIKFCNLVYLTTIMHCIF